MALRRGISGWLWFGVLCGASMAAAGAPPANSRTAADATTAKDHVRGASTNVADARARNTALQARVAGLEQQNAEQQKKLQQRDAEIDTLQQQLQAASVPAAATTGGH